jgi:membrane-associated protease RseP (regulator of RpoE activity)
MGAIIRHRGPIPDRKALFDVGAAGPLAGLAASIIVTIIGLSLPVEPPPPEAEGFRIGIPPLFGFLIELIQPDSPYIHPVAFAGWIGMFLTFLNLLPAGQLDGGHVARSMLGKYHEAVSQSIPLILMMLGTFLIFVLRVNGGIWIFWGFFTMIFASGGHPPPLDDERKLDMERIWLGILTFALGIACATPVPFSEA